MAEFARLSSSEYPKSFNEGDENQSYNFIPPVKVQSGKLRGTQVITADDGSRIELGIISGTDNEFGIAMFDADGSKSIKIGIADRNFTVFDPDADGQSRFMAGKLPDDTYGAAGSNEGYSVEDGFED